MNRVELEGGVTYVNDPKPLYDRWVQSFTVAVSEARWNSETRTDEVVSTFWSVEHWTDRFDQDNLLAKGDKVYVLGSLGQSKKKAGEEGPTHTRIYAKLVIVVKSSTEGRRIRGVADAEPSQGDGHPDTPAAPF